MRFCAGYCWTHKETKEFSQKQLSESSAVCLKCEKQIKDSADKITRSLGLCQKS